MISNQAIDSPVEERVLSIPILIAIRGPLAGRILNVGDQVVSLGRETSNVIVVGDPLVSRHHCVIRNKGEQHTIEDLNSSNGTYVNGERVQLTSLKEDTLIEIGASSFVFRLQDSEELITQSQDLLDEESVST